MILNIRLDIMADRNNRNAVRQTDLENRLRQRRQAAGISQKQLAERAGVTRQAVAAVEANQYCPATSVALLLARVLRCRVEDLFSIGGDGEVIDGELLGRLPRSHDHRRAQVTQVGSRLLVRALDGVGELTSLTASADGLILDADAKSARVKVRLLKDRETLRRRVVLGGCDPAMFLAAEHLRRHDQESLVPCLMGNGSALAALKRGELHAAGVHFVDDRSSARNPADLRRALGGLDCTVVTFAHWEEGFIVRQGNPKNIRAAADIARSTVRLINREKGSGARRLLDRELHSAGIPSTRVKGYSDEVLSHLEVASRVSFGLADAGVGVRAAATICGLAFIPLQRERYDLVIPKGHYESLQGLRHLLDLIVGKPFRDELEALGGYDTRDTGKFVDTHEFSAEASE
jgi:molybdate-binding protein/DNA-binding XRE family transcriptional regulator